MKTAEANGKKLKSAYTIIQKAGKGVKVAADTGYKAGYFMAKHPNIENAKKQLQANYKPGLIAIAGLAIGMLGLVGFMMNVKNQQD